MFRRKLTALEFHSVNTFDYQDETSFRNLVCWLENQKIRQYKVEDRVALEKIDDVDGWPKAFQNYLDELGLTGLDANTDRETQIEQLLSHAIKLEYTDNIDKYTSNPVLFANNNDENYTSTTAPQDHLDKLDYTGEEFTNGRWNLLRLLNIPSNANDPTSELQAISQLISERLSSSAIDTHLKTTAAATAAAAKSTALARNTQANTETAPIQLTLDSIDLGFDTKDKSLNDAAKILRLLHIRELRDLQTSINETIVAIQSVTADPKTDSSLGRVGR